mmetsp:Transcript_90246/g.269262  ORF Transcript_90246/g.269262 Transcript_90246/m.269262 type:complete len:234 (+) Transcript_90246:45-746(+)
MHGGTVRPPPRGGASPANSANTIKSRLHQDVAGTKFGEACSAVPGQPRPECLQHQSFMFADQPLDALPEPLLQSNGSFPVSDGSASVDASDDDLFAATGSLCSTETFREALIVFMGQSRPSLLQHRFTFSFGQSVCQLSMPSWQSEVSLLCLFACRNPGGAARNPLSAATSAMGPPSPTPAAQIPRSSTTAVNRPAIMPQHSVMACLVPEWPGAAISNSPAPLSTYLYRVSLV